MRCFPVDMRRLWAGGVALLLTTWFSASAPVMAETLEACVRCAGPDQTYRCQASVDDAAPSDTLRYLCMTQIARKHVHQTCSVLRSPATCDGMAVTYVYRGDVPEALAVGDKDAPPPAGEPKTLADMTRNSVGASVKAAGEAIGDATKRTLKCLGSAFSSC